VDWNVLYGAGYPDWAFRADLPPPDPGCRWVFTGRGFLALPTSLHDLWLRAHTIPVTHSDLNEALRRVDPDAVPERQRELLVAGAFCAWPAAFTEPFDTLDALSLWPQPSSPNPLPGVLPDQEWAAELPMSRLWDAFSALPDDERQAGFRTFLAELLQRKAAWLVARPLPENHR
jgi:hypothetical protein